MSSEKPSIYFAGASRIAMRENGTLMFMIGNHLGSTSIITDESGNLISETKYKAWGETRYSSGTNPTDYTYTGQYSYTSDFGLMFYNARWYDPYLNHFTQPDSIVPDPHNPQDWDRYAYARNNPLRYTDPTGHNPQCGPDGIYCHGGDWKNPVYPTSLDKSLLSKNPYGITDVSAEMVYDYYIKLWEQQDGWWWEAYGDSYSGFTIWDYFSLISAQEGFVSPSQVNPGAMAEGGMRFYYERVEAGLHSSDIYGLLDWWASFSQSQSGLILNNLIPEKYGNKAIYGNDFSDYHAFSVIGGGFRNPNNDWLQGYDPYRPYGWGNQSSINSRNPSAGGKFALNVNIMFGYMPGDDPFYVPPGCAMKAWVDQNLSTNACSHLPSQ